MAQQHKRRATGEALTPRARAIGTVAVLGAAFERAPVPLAVLGRRLQPVRRNPAWSELFAAVAGDAAAGDPRRWPDAIAVALIQALREETAVTVRLPLGDAGERVLSITTQAVKLGRRSLLVATAGSGDGAIDAGAERAAALGQLLASIVHELNNQLSTILAQSQLARRGARAKAQGERLDRVIEAARQSARIVTNLLDLARRRPVRRTPIDVDTIVQRAIGLVQADLDRLAIEVAFAPAGDLPAVLGDATGMTQVVVNLLTNARDALAEVPPPRRVAISTRFDPDAGLVELSVADNGPGIPPAILRRIFQPFFTTKAEGKGTGLGLSLCITQTKELGGGITARNREAGGAEFLVRLPARRTAAEAPDAPAPRAAGAAAILVVDDDRDMARYVQSLLRRDGHAVDLAGDGGEALRRIDRRRYDLIVSDVHMAGIDGIELFRRLEREQPEAVERLVFLTGDVANRELEQFFVLAGRPVIAKPFDDDRFLSIVGQMLRRPR
ncbi:MAG: ATP-binding protein [Alphaproteobacteria bacterium]